MPWGPQHICLALALLSPAPGSTADLRSKLEEIAGTVQGRVGIAVLLVESGQVVSLNGSRRYPMQSVYKLPIGMTILHQVDQERIRLDQTARVAESDLAPPPVYSPIRDKYPHGANLSVLELLRFMVSESDGTASDVLVRLAGGSHSITRYLRRLNVDSMVVATTEAEMARDQRAQYRNWASPRAAVDLLRVLYAGRILSESSRLLLLRLMTETGTGAHRIKGMLPADAVVAHKTGTSGTAAGVTAATNDVGIVTLPGGRHLAIAVFVSDSTADEAAREGVIAKAARAAWDYFTNTLH